MDEHRKDNLEGIRADARIGAAISVIYRHGSVFLGSALTETGIGAGQHACFLLIAERPGIRQEELSRVLALDKAHVARAVSRLEDLGYIVRKPYPDDARSHALAATDRGMAILPQVAEAISRWNRRLFESLTPEEGDVLASLLERAAKSFL